MMLCTYGDIDFDFGFDFDSVEIYNTRYLPNDPGHEEEEGDALGRLVTEVG